jgi:hypothetical protein
VRPSVNGYGASACGTRRTRGRSTLEVVRREFEIGTYFSAEAFGDAFAAFARTYNVAPLRALCAPDVFARYCALFERDPSAAHLHSTRSTFEGVPVHAAILPPGVVAFEGEVDEERMGDW